MKFTVKDMDIATGGQQIAILNEKDAELLDVRHEERVRIRFRRKETVAILDISESDKAVPAGYIGLFEEVLDALNVKDGDVIDFELTTKPESVSFIRSKLQGKPLSYNQIYQIIDDISKDKLTSIEKTYFVSATYAKGLSLSEIIFLTKAIVKTGKQLHFSRPVFDKHCIGGIPGNRTTMCLVPIVAAAGLLMPKTSSRAITSPSGTADTMEALASVTMTASRLKQIVARTNGCIVWGGAMNLAPADDKIINVEHPLALDVEGQMLASVMAKKASVGASYALIDIPYGKHAKCKSITHALHLKRMFEALAKNMHIKPKVIITDGSQPIGNGIGPVLEANDSLAVLKNEDNAPADLKNKALRMADILLKMGGVKEKAFSILESGDAWKKMRQIINAQGEPARKYGLGREIFEVKSPKSGKVIEINNTSINKLARVAGAPSDKGAGLFIYKKKHDMVKKGDVLFSIYAENGFKMNVAEELIKQLQVYRINGRK